MPVSGIVTAPAGVLGSGGITFAGIISGNSGNIISANGGNIIANNASGLVSNNAGGFHTLAVEQAPVEGAEVYLADSTGRPLPGLAHGTTDAGGHYNLPRVPVNYTYMVVARVKAPSTKEGVMESLVRTAAAGSSNADINLPTTVVTEASLAARAGALGLDGAKAVIFHCRSGARTQATAQALQACAQCDAYILEGGLDAWKKAGLPVEVDKAQPLELQRQVQIAAGSIVLIGVILGAAASPWFYLLSAFVGAGLVFAGLSGFCGMARVLMKMPWNRQTSIG